MENLCASIIKRYIANKSDYTSFRPRELFRRLQTNYEDFKVFSEEDFLSIDIALSFLARLHSLVVRE